MPAVKSCCHLFTSVRFATYLPLRVLGFFVFSSPVIALCPASGVGVVHIRLSTISLNIFSQTIRPVWMKLDRDVPWVKVYKNCSKNLIPSITLVARATKKIIKKNAKSLKNLFL